MYIVLFKTPKLINYTCIFLRQDQLKRYTEIKMSDLSPALAARKTKEFRCPPQEQVMVFIMKMLVKQDGFGIFGSPKQK